jgi:hypothetical protein
MTRQRREQIIGVSARISQLREEIRAKESELRRAEIELDALINQDDANSNLVPPSGETSSSQAANQASGRSLAEHILAALDAEPGREIEAEEFLPRIPNAKINSLRSALARLAKQERIVRGERGKYRSVILPPAQSVGGEVET